MTAVKKFLFNETFLSLQLLDKMQMDNNFEIIFLKEAFEYLQSLDTKHSNKILFNIRKA
jgi:hypothetical protein